ncbi:NADH:ubiquinone reductase (Na(+)-transporting) subunit C [bacterium]|nr:NADH:ubiquinone reductase (Na(+)-transporting) subunit C [bacterium]
MSINKEGNGYTLLFAIIMVVVVGGLLAYISSSLKPMQQANVKNEKMQNILQAIGLEEIKELQDSGLLTREKAGEIFNDYITERIILNYDGEIVAGSRKTNLDSISEKDPTDAFNVDVRKYYNNLTKIEKKYEEGSEEFKNALTEKGITYPLFVCEKDGQKYYVTYFSGKGLWDDIWGYISFKEDGRTINGSVFDHKGETPGLGSKIKTKVFNDDFLGKVITDDNNEYRPIKVIKPGKVRNDYQVQGISGATFTAIGDGNNMGVQRMMERSLVVYQKYFSSVKSTSIKTPVIIDTLSMDTLQMVIDSTAVLAIK